MAEFKEQKQRDLMHRCMEGLTVYAAQRHYAENYYPAPIRELIASTVSYWRLDDDSDHLMNERYLEPFDKAMLRVSPNRGRLEGLFRGPAQPPAPPTREQEIGTLAGLIRHAREMDTTQGMEYADQIIEAVEMAKEIADYWDHENPALDKY